MIWQLCFATAVVVNPDTILSTEQYVLEFVQIDTFSQVVMASTGSGESHFKHALKSVLYMQVDPHATTCKMGNIASIFGKYTTDNS